MVVYQYEIIPIPALEDNYIWIVVNSKRRSALVVDPGAAAPVLAYLQKQHLVLRGILLTHHHGDHTNGVADLVQAYPVPIVGSIHSRYANANHRIQDGECFRLNSDFPEITAIAIPGHTLDHMAYRMENAVFSGDTLFAGGCGRLFEGSAEQMFESLAKLSAQPDHTQIYCGHEYTVANLRFAKKVEPHNQALLERLEHTEALRRQHQPTLPSRLEEEKRTNPFLRCDVDAVKQTVSAYVGRALHTPVEVFAALRQWKNG